MKTPNINMTYVVTTRAWQCVKIGDKVDTDVYKNCYEVFIVSNGETTFAGYAVPHSGLVQTKYTLPMNLYYSDDKTHIISFQEAMIDANGRTYSFMA